MEKICSYTSLYQCARIWDSSLSKLKWRSLMIEMSIVLLRAMIHLSISSLVIVDKKARGAISLTCCTHNITVRPP
jgi:hypothetical protein